MKVNSGTQIHVMRKGYTRCIQKFPTWLPGARNANVTSCNCIAILWVSQVSFAVASQRVFIVVSVYLVIDSVRKHLDTPSCMLMWLSLIWKSNVY